MSLSFFFSPRTIKTIGTCSCEETKRQHAASVDNRNYTVVWRNFLKTRRSRASTEWDQPTRLLFISTDVEYFPAHRSAFRIDMQSGRINVPDIGTFCFRKQYCRWRVQFAYESMGDGVQFVHWFGGGPKGDFYSILHNKTAGRLIVFMQYPFLLLKSLT